MMEDKKPKTEPMEDMSLTEFLKSMFYFFEVQVQELTNINLFLIRRGQDTDLV